MDFTGSPPVRRGPSTHILPRRFLFSLAVLFAFNTASTLAGEWSGEVTAAYRYFSNDPLDARQHEDIGILTFLGEYYHDWDDGNQRFAFTPYLRVYEGTGDDGRVDGDIQELYWRKSFAESDLSIGIRKYFWGVTESVHLVDIINQTDLAQDIDTEDKLGQPVIDYTLVKNWGDLSFYVMPYFRERRFPNERGRGRFPLVVDTANPVYESGAEEQHVDFAVRWSHFIGDWDIGLSHFSGTGRDPRLEPGFNDAGELVLTPVYEQIDQTGIDVQATKGDWLWKLEVISREQGGDRFTAAASGFEYTFYGVFNSAADIGLLTEYLFDDRGDNATTPFENDVFVGARLAMNDAQDTELLAGVIYDPQDESRFALIEGSRRIGQSWKINLEARIFSDIPQDNLLFGLRNDDYVEISIGKFF
ncbi:MAG: hypothetical protein MJA83_05490 [Gammaproteobacteria bacterium]|nr:hypothetical protein [Gammaproteobacteria bacterium]